MNRLLNNPRRLRRLVPALIVVGAVLGILSVFFRDNLTRGGGAHSATYLLDVAGWLIAILGAVLEARVGAILFTYQPAPVRRRATLLAVLGVAAALGGCVALSTLRGDGVTSVLRFAAGALLVGGVGAGLGGLGTLALTYGGRYAADRLATLDDD